MGGFSFIVPESRAVAGIEVALRQQTVRLDNGVLLCLNVVVCKREGPLIGDRDSVDQHPRRDKRTVTENALIRRHEKVMRRFTRAECMGTDADRSAGKIIRQGERT